MFTWRRFIQIIGILLLRMVNVFTNSEDLLKISWSLVMAFQRVCVPQKIRNTAMAPSSSSPSARAAVPVQKLLFVRRPSSLPPPRKYRSMVDIMRTAKYTVVESKDYSDVNCDQCGSSKHDDLLLLCDKCNKAFHMLCLCPIVVRVPIGPWYCPTCSDHPPVKPYLCSFVILQASFKECYLHGDVCSTKKEAEHLATRVAALILLDSESGTPRLSFMLQWKAPRNTTGFKLALCSWWHII